MRKITLFCILLIGYAGTIFSQGCLPEGITFTTQEEIDNFQVNYPGCTEIEGGVKIGDWESNDIMNLDGLNVITSIGDYLFIGSYGDYTLLTSLSGLDNLSIVGGEFRIMGNDRLKTLSSLNNLNTIGGALKIQSNDSLTHITGFNNLVSTGGSFDIGPNASLTNVSGFTNLTTIGEDLSVGENYVLSELLWLSSITTVNGDVVIVYNYEITSLTGLENINPNSFVDLYVYGNDLLTQCDIDNICEYIATSSGYIEIEANAPGCNNQEQVEEACALSIGENYLIKDLSISPNPFLQTTTLEFELLEPTHIELTIYNHLGVEVYSIREQQYKDKHEIKINAGNLPSGVYYCVLKTNEGVQTRKMVKL